MHTHAQRKKIEINPFLKAAVFSFFTVTHFEQNNASLFLFSFPDLKIFKITCSVLSRKTNILASNFPLLYFL